ncbi:hypothetical protein [Pedobacter sp. UBA4863]|uniref:hypothetical protein n=3 Tax=Pedobacter TaxID=84567 RepID=UPI0025D0D224|nr:hypothetical protein [Pedobacter sp. UBA4863]
MSFGKSFERELGKNTGKWVSNVIFGDGHSTPYRRVGSTQHREPRRTQAELRHELEIQRIATEERIRRNQIAAENKRQKKEQNLLIDSAVLQNIDMISSIKVTNNSEQLVDLLSDLSIQVKTNKWHGNNEEGKIRNKYNEALLEKYNQAFLRLKSIDPNNAQIEYFEKNIKNFRKKRFLKKNQILLIIVSFIFAFFCVFLLSEGLFTIVFGPIALIVVAIIGYKYYKRNQKNDTAKTTNVRYTQEERKIEEENIIEEEAVFFDLNENERIEKRLSEIWNKYRGVNNQILSKKPIFSADGVNESILFVGINPSYNPSDDNTFIKSNDGNSLMYGSFYQRPDAPEYFKALEFFANKLNKGYTHINLLYAREDNRELLLDSDHNFIREQLELTYETILKLKPVAIFFFSDYCKNLIFGADRWVNPNSESNGSYILNGTNFPVFFTNDITSMTAIEQIELIRNVEKTI